MKKRRYFMMKRQIFLWMGLVVLFTVFCLSQEIFATEYKVRPGDSLAKIAKRHGVTTQALMEANGLTGSALKPKQVLVIPEGGKKHTATSKKTHSQNGSSYIVKKGDTLQTIAQKTGYSVNHIKKLNHVNARSLKVGQKIVLSRRGPVKEIAIARTNEMDEYDEDDDLLEDDEDVVLNDSLLDTENKTDSSAVLLGKWDSPNE